MTKPRAQSTPASRLAARAIRLLLVLAAIGGVSLGAVLWLTDPGQGRRPHSAVRRQEHSRSVGSMTAAQAQPSPAPEPPVPLYSDDWTDDSGYGLAIQYMKPITDPQSLDEIHTAAAGRAQRGIAVFTQQLAAVPRSTPAGRAQALQLMAFIGLLHMSDGQFAEAERWIADAQNVDPNCPRLLRANLEALRGVAALRRGEADNCVSCCNEASCIFPLGNAAIHQLPSGSREAIRRFTAYLDMRPDDLGIRWLLNVAHMTLGTYPAGVSEKYLIPLEPFQSKGDIGRFPNVARRVGLAERGENMAGGVIVDDFNGDGLLDVFYSTIDTARGCALFVNRGDGTFDDHSASSGLESQIGAENCVHADYDNDGDLDVLLLRGAWELPRRPSLLRNNGEGEFTDVTVAAGLAVPMSSETAGWSDYDADGDLDLYMGGEYRPDSPDRSSNQGRLYRNNGDGTFTDVADAAGVRNDRFCRGVAWGDYDDDGRPDLYLSNQGQRNRLYHNNGDGTFTDVAAELGVIEPVASYACWFWDYDNDGKLDILVTGSGASLAQIIKSHLGEPTGGERPRLYHNEGGRFTDVALDAGLDRVWLPMGSNCGDLDNDGYLDFYLGTGSPPYSFLIPNVLMHNVAGRRFEDVTTSSGTGHLQKGHGIAFADWDRDGDLDLFLESGGAVSGDKAHNSLFENPGHGNHWLTLRLVGTRANRGGVGARVRIDVTGPGAPRSVYRDIGPGSSFGNNPLTPTIGVGQASAIAALQITWPGSGTKQLLKDLPVDRAIEVTEGREGYRLLDSAPLRPAPQRTAEQVEGRTSTAVN